MNVLSFDVEEWFHLLDNDSTRSEAQWKNYEVRIYENMDRIFRILEDTNTKATFFVIGWIAKKYPDIVKEISKKYEIGSHTMNHQLVWQQNIVDFKEDVDSSVKLLEDISGKKVKYFRAPGFSITEKEIWAYDVLMDLGIEIDCSVFPASHAHGGMASYGKGVPGIFKVNDRKIKILPISTKEIFGRNIIFTGGGYFRFFPYKLIKKWAKESDEFLLSYIHPRDLDASQPIIKELPLKRKFKSYYGLNGAEKKFRRFLKDFNFIDIAEADSRIDWENVKELSFTNNEQIK